MKTFEEYLEKMGYSWNDFDRTYEMESLIEKYADEKVKQALSLDDVVGRSEQLSCHHSWKSRFNAKRGSYVICIKCSEER